MMRTILTGLFAATLALLAACGQPPAEGESKVVRIAGIAVSEGGQNRLISLPAIVEQQEWLAGALKERGWTLEWVDIPPAVGGPAVNEGFAARTIDLAYYGDLPTLIARSSGLDVKVIQPGATHNVYLLVPPNSPARTVVDLKGKRIALHRGRPFEPSFLRLIESEQLTLDDFTIVNINPLAGTAALASGQVDALVLAGPEAWVLTDKKIGRILWSTRDSPESWKMRADLVARTPFIDAHPEIGQIVTEGFARALAWSAHEENREAYYTLMAIGGTPIDAVRRDGDNRSRPWAEHLSPVFDDQIVDRYAHISGYAAETGLIRGPVDPDILLDRRFSERTLAAIGYAGAWPPSGVRP